MEVDGSWNSNADGGNGSVEINVSSQAYSHVFALVTGLVAASCNPTSSRGRKTTPLKIPRQIIVREIDSPTVCRRSRIRCVLNRAISPLLSFRRGRQRRFLSPGCAEKTSGSWPGALARLIEIDGSCDLPRVWARPEQTNERFIGRKRAGTFIRVPSMELFHFLYILQRETLRKAIWWQSGNNDNNLTQSGELWIRNWNFFVN